MTTPSFFFWPSVVLKRRSQNMHKKDHPYFLFLVLLVVFRLLLLSNHANVQALPGFVFRLLLPNHANVQPVIRFPFTLILLFTLITLKP